MSYTSTEGPTAILKLREALGNEGEHVVVAGRATYHIIADILGEVVREKGISLGLPEKSVTW